jgi:hypothetical protein
MSIFDYIYLPYIYDDPKTEGLLTAVKDIIFEPNVDFVDLQTKVFEKFNSALIDRLLSCLFVL